MIPAKLIRTSSFRLALLYAALFTGSVLVLFGITYWWATGFAVQDEVDDIQDEFVAIQDELHLAGADRIADIVANHIRQHASESGVYLVLDPAGAKIAGNLPTMAPRLGSFTLRDLAGTQAVPAYGFRLENGDYLLIGQDPASLREMRQIIARAFVLSIALTAVLAIGGGMLIARHSLTRVEGVARATGAIMGGDLAQRLPVAGSGDEFDALAQTVNAMLDRIEELMRSIRQVTNDIAHDLRTPLTRLRHRLEQGRDKATSIAELKTSIDGAIEQVDGILQTFSALLRIAQIEGGTPAPTTVDLSALLQSIADDFTPAAEDTARVLTAAIVPGLAVAGERELIAQMVANLLDNAIRHTRPGVRIVLEARTAGDKIEIAVADSGGGIPPDERDKVLRPFYRRDASRATEGSGLGLSLVAAIAKRLGATLSLSDNGPGLRVTVVLTAAQATA